MERRKKVARTNVKNVRGPGTASSISPPPPLLLSLPPLLVYQPSLFSDPSTIVDRDLEEKNRGHFLWPKTWYGHIIIKKKHARDLTTSSRNYK